MTNDKCSSAEFLIGEPWPAKDKLEKALVVYKIKEKENLLKSNAGWVRESLMGEAPYSLSKMRP